ncbi:MAG: carbohydrate porin, partial [Planctomycetota bacterium]
IVHYEPTESWYISAAAVDAEADVRETGFRTAFHGTDNFFSMLETGFLPEINSPTGPMQGAYRVGLWYDPQPKDRFGGGSKRDDIGFYISADQMVYKERADNADTQGLGLFARYGWADSDVNEIRCFWSFGAQYQGLLPGRDDDVVAFGLAQGRLSPEAGFSASHETSMEMYYQAWITPWLHVAPSVQYILNPGGDSSVGDAVVLGFRLGVVF